MLASLTMAAQVENAGTVRKRSAGEKESAVSTVNTGSERLTKATEAHTADDADLTYARTIYRRLDLTKAANAPLFFPEDVIDGKENLFRIILNHVAAGDVPAYEYLDGREIFSDRYRMNVAEMAERFGIVSSPAKGSTEKNPKIIIDEADVPASQVLNYYIIEKWEFDRRSNRMKTRVEAICPVLDSFDDFGGSARYPMFWVKYADLRPFLNAGAIVTSDDNNLPRYTIDEFFSLDLYDGEIYKTQNVRNLSMAQLFPDEDDRKRACDSIDNRLRTYGKHLWVPSREEFLAMKEKEQDSAGNASDSIPERTVVTAGNDNDVKQTSSARAKKRQTARKKKSSANSSGKSSSRQSKVGSGASNAAAEKSVRRRKK